MSEIIQRGKHYYHNVDSDFHAPALRADIEARRQRRPGWADDEQWPDIEIENIRSGGWYRATWQNGQDYEELTYLIATVGNFPIREEGHFQLLHHGGKPAQRVAKRLSQACYGKPGLISVKIAR